MTTGPVALHGSSVESDFFPMDDSRMRRNRSWAPAAWLCAGFLASYLSIFLFAHLVSPVFIKLLREINATSLSIFIKNPLNMIFAYLADFILCFAFAAVLSYFTGFTKVRLSLFVFGAVAKNLYIKIAALISHMGAYSEMSYWASSYVYGFIFLLLIVPFFSYLGCRLGGAMRARTKSPRTIKAAVTQGRGAD